MAAGRRLCLVCVALVAGAGCGDDDDGERARLPSAHITMSEAQRVLEARTGARRVRESSPLERRVQPRPLGSARMRVPGGDEFDVLAFASPATLRRAWPSLQDLGPPYAGGGAAAAANVLAIFPRVARTGTFDEVRGVLRHLDDVCGPTVEVSDRVSDLEEVCASEGEAVPGRAGDEPREEPADPGEAVRLGGLAYSVAMTRQLNPYTRPDGTFVGGRRPGEGRTFLGVFVRVCNEAGAARTPTSRLRLLGAFGDAVSPIELPRDNAYAYHPRPIEAGRCLPADGTVAARVNDGALVLFEVSYEMLDERPLSLQIVGAGGEDRRVRLDL